MRRIAFGVRRLVAAFGFSQRRQAPSPILWALVLSLVPSGTPAWAGAISLKSGPATIAIDAATSDDKTEIAYAPIPFTLTVDGVAPLKVKLPKAWTTADAWHVFPRGPAAETPLDKNRTRWTQDFFLEPLLAGTHELQLEPLQIQEAGGPWQTVPWKPIQVTVRPPQSEGDASQLRDITSIEELPTPHSWTESWPWFAGVGGLLVLLGLAASAQLSLRTKRGRLGAAGSRPACRPRLARPRRGAALSHPSLERAAPLSGTPLLRPGAAADDARVPPHGQPGRHVYRRAAAVFA